jgi:hypothetical protein
MAGGMITIGNMGFWGFGMGISHYPSFPHNLFVAQHGLFFLGE